MNNEIKSGDFVRLTDPSSNGEVVRIENVNEHGFASWLGGSQATDMEQINMEQINSDLIYYYENLSELIRHIESKIGIKLYPESAVEYWKNRAEKAEAENALNEKLLDKEHNKLLDAKDEIAAYKDKTLISADFLSRNKFELQKVQNGIDKEPQPEYIYCNDAIEISAELRDEERGIWRVWMNFLDECCPTDLDICTFGQFRMFLAIEGLDEIAKQLKS